MLNSRRFTHSFQKGCFFKGGGKSVGMLKVVTDKIMQNEGLVLHLQCVKKSVQHEGGEQRVILLYGCAWSALPGTRVFQVVPSEKPNDYTGFYASPCNREVPSIFH